MFSKNEYPEYAGDYRKTQELTFEFSIILNNVDLSSQFENYRKRNMKWQIKVKICKNIFIS